MGCSFTANGSNKKIRFAILLMLVAVSAARNSIYLIELTAPGARTPDYPDLSQELFQRYGIDRLTPNGERMMYTLGSQIRKDYPDIFSGSAVSSEYEVFSSSGFAAQVSARSHMLALYPKHKYDTINTNNPDTRYPPWVDIEESYEATTTSLPFGVKPIPLKIDSSNTDYIFLNQIYRVCPLAARQQTIASSDYLVRLTKDFKKFGEDLNSMGFSSEQFFQKKD